MTLLELPWQFQGVPLHPLVVHFAVVLVPLCALLTIVLMFVQRWRRRFTPLALLGLTVGTGATVVAKQTGESLAQRLGEPRAHVEWGDIAPLPAIAALVLALVWSLLQWRADRRRADDAEAKGAGLAGLVVGVLMIVAGLAATYVVLMAGHTGATAAWSGRVPTASGSAVPPVAVTSATGQPSTSSPAMSSATGSSGQTTTPLASTPPASASTSTSAASSTAITMAQVQQHNSVRSCWAAVNGNVYDLTNWIGQHPGGREHIIALCGTDATAAFNAQHGGQSDPAAELARFKIGTLAS